ncbi:hypothetical protein EV658_1409 [Phaeovulum veldkampii DSM 11550]|nr:hypothetical protein EV658_1409 [Phaeovulum veldkampii DSM 11550]
MAKDLTTGSKRSGGKSKQSGASFRAKHRVYSAASADRKKATGLIRVSVWVPVWAVDLLKRFAKRLCEGHRSDETECDQTIERQITANSVVSAMSRKARKRARPDDGQLDLFGPA